MLALNDLIFLNIVNGSAKATGRQRKAPEGGFLKPQSQALISSYPFFLERRNA